MPRKRVTFIVIPPNDGQVHEFKFSTKLLLLLGVFCLAFVGALGYYCLGYYAHTEEQGVIASLLEENAVLEESLAANDEQIAEMVEVMDKLAADDQLLRNLHDMPLLTDEDRRGGMGGGDDLPDDYTQLPSSKRRLLDNISSRIHRLQIEAVVQDRSFAKLHKSYLESQKYLATLPSIAPVPREWTWISSEFGKRDDPFTGRPQKHTGIDFAGRKGTPIYAAADGIVIYSLDRTTGLGNVIVIQHDAQQQNDDGEVFTIPGIYRTEYGHLEKRLVEKGDLVKRGDQIGRMGSSGRSTGTHLHYAVRLAARLRSADKGYVNPMHHLLNWETDDPVSGWIAARTGQ